MIPPVIAGMIPIPYLHTCTPNCTDDTLNYYCDDTKTITENQLSLCTNTYKWYNKRQILPSSQHVLQYMHTVKSKFELKLNLSWQNMRISLSMMICRIIHRMMTIYDIKLNVQCGEKSHTASNRCHAYAHSPS